MKKIISSVLSVILASMFLLAGCGSDMKSLASSTADKTASAGTAVSIASSTADKTSSSGTTLSSNTSTEQQPLKKYSFGKVLIVYYSMSGNTDKVANSIKELTGGDIFSIETVENYARADVTDVVKKQISEGYKPKLANSVSNIEQYDTIFIGSPVWWFSVSLPVMSFLSQYDLKSKKIVPFCTCGSNYGDFFKQFEKACKGGKVQKGIDFKSEELNDMDKAKSKLENWLKEIDK